MSGPVPSPSMKATIGWSGTCSLPCVMVMGSPCGIVTLPAMMPLSVFAPPSLARPATGGEGGGEASRGVSGSGQRVERRPSLEPTDLLVRHRVSARHGHRLTARLVDGHLDRPPR